MDRINAAAETVKDAIWGEDTTRDESVVGTASGTHRAGERSTIGDSLTHDDGYSRNQTAMKGLSGQHPSTVGDIEAMQRGSARGPAGDHAKMPGAFGSDITAGSSRYDQTGSESRHGLTSNTTSGHGLTGTTVEHGLVGGSGHGLTGGRDTISGHDHTLDANKQSGQGGLLSGITGKIGMGNTTSSSTYGQHPGTSTGSNDNTLTGSITSGLSNLVAATGLTGGNTTSDTYRDTDRSLGQTSTTHPTTGTTTGRNDNTVTGNISSGLSNIAASTGLTSDNKSSTYRDTDRSLGHGSATHSTTGRNDNTMTGNMTSGLSNLASSTGLTGNKSDTHHDTDRSLGHSSTTHPTTGRNDNTVTGNISSGLSNIAASTGLTGDNKTGTYRDTDRSHENPLSHHHDTTSTHHDRSTDHSGLTGRDTTSHHRDHSPPGAGLSSGIIAATAATGLAKNKDITTRHNDDYRTGTTHHDDHHTHHSTGVPTTLSSGPGGANPFTSDRTEVYTSSHKHDHPTGGVSGLTHKDHTHDHHTTGVTGIPLGGDRTHDHHTTGVTGIPLGGDHSHTSTTNPFRSNPTHNTHSPAQSTESGDYRSINAPAGPTGTAISTTSNKPHDSPFQDVNQGRLGEPPSPRNLTTGLTNRAGDDTSARKSTVGGMHEPSTLTGSAAGGPGAQVPASVGGYPDASSQPSDIHQGSARPHEEPKSTGLHGNRYGQQPMSSTGQHGIDIRRKSIPLVEGHPESSGPKTHPTEKLPSGPGTGEGTGEKWVKSTGVVAEGGNFDAAAPGAGREADRLLDEHGIHHGADIKPGTQTYDTTPGKPSLGTETAGHQTTSGAHDTHHTTGAHDTTTKPSLGDKIKEKLHLGHH